MNADTPKYWMAHQVWSVILGFDKNPRSREILEDYLYYCRSPQIVTEYPNMCGEPNLDGFREHRWEQSIISILVERYGVKGVWDGDHVLLAPPFIVEQSHLDEITDKLARAIDTAIA